MKNETVRSNFLFAMPSAAEGLARLVDFGNTFDSYNATPAPGDPDARALAQDWLAVGDALREAIDKVAG
jgi:hypothetical protein